MEKLNLMKEFLSVQGRKLLIQISICTIIIIGMFINYDKLYLITGEEVWSYYGHSALRIQDKAHGSDVAVNYLNPASYSAIDSMTFILDAGISGQVTNFNENGVKKNAITPTLVFITLAVIIIALSVFEWKRKKNFWVLDAFLLILTGLPGLILFIFLNLSFLIFLSRSFQLQNYE